MDLLQLTLDTEIATLSIADLSLDPIICQGLIDKDYTTLGDIYSLQAEGVSLVLNLDYMEIQSFWSSVLEVVSNPDRWTFKADNITQVKNKVNLTDILSDWIKKFFVELDRPSVDTLRYYTVLYRRYGLDGKSTYTLEAIGDYLSLSRERVRQIQDKAFSELYQNVFSEISSNITEEMLELKSLIQTELSYVKLERELFQFITDRYGVALTSALEHHYRLLFELFGWQRISEKTNNIYRPEPFWIMDKSKITETRVFDAGARIIKILQDRCIRVEYFEIKVLINSK